MSSINYQKISNILGMLSVIVGFVLSISIMYGDDLGRVNILHLLLLYVFFPIISLLLVVIVKTRESNIVSWVLKLSIFTKPLHVDYLRLEKEPFFSTWLFYQSQKNYLLFNLSTLFGFFAVLLVNDVTFIWRSTLLTSDQLFPLIKLLALPWFFLESAQPVLSMFVSSEDSRLLLKNDLLLENSWWQYVLLIQIVYATMPRVVLYVYSKRNLNNEISKKVSDDESLEKFKCAQAYQQKILSLDRVNLLEQPLNDFLLLYWIELPAQVKSILKTKVGEPEKEYNFNSIDYTTLEQIVSQNKSECVLIVPSWEPPLGELADFMNQSRGYLIPIDWVGNNLQAISENHLDEWRRFCQPISTWQLLSHKDFL